MRDTLKPAAFAAGLVMVPSLALAAPALTVSVEIPKLNVAEYHRPYVALWVESPDAATVKTLAVWYDMKQAKNEGTTWLKDLRTWWRREGRGLTMPADGISSATKAPGKQQVVFGPEKFAGLAPGQYNLVVEAAREVGGREVVKAPFVWPPKGPAKTTTAAGQSELGAVAVSAKP